MQDSEDKDTVQKLVQAQISIREGVDNDMGLGTRPNETGCESGGTSVRDFSFIIFFWLTRLPKVLQTRKPQETAQTMTVHFEEDNAVHPEILEAPAFWRVWKMILI